MRERRRGASRRVWGNLRVSEEELVRAESLRQQVHTLGGITVELGTQKKRLTAPA